VIRLLSDVGAYALFVVALARATVRDGVPRARVLDEAYDIGIKSLSVLLILNIFIGSNLAIQGYNALAQLGGQRLVGLFVALAGVRELAPIITASMIAAKAGTEMTSQISVMRITEQIDALEVMAVDPLSHVVSPRVLGILLVMPALTIIALAATLLAGYTVSVYQLGLNGDLFWEYAARGVRPIDMLYAVIKALVFGVIICTLSCWFGFRCERSPQGVGKATNRAVVASAVTCVIVNYFLSELLYGISGGGGLSL